MAWRCRVPATTSTRETQRSSHCYLGNRNRINTNHHHPLNQTPLLQTLSPSMAAVQLSVAAKRNTGILSSKHEKTLSLTNNNTKEKKLAPRPSLVLTQEEKNDIRFQRIDANGDGEITAAEWTAAKEKEHQQQQKHHKPNQSHIGAKWRAYWATHGHAGKHHDPGCDASVIPNVDIKIQINALSNIDEKTGTFDIEFLVMADWVDPSLEREAAEKDSDVVWEEHFIPSFEIAGAISSNTPDFEPRVRPKDKSGEWNHATMTVKYQSTVRVRFNFRKFPFERQVLEILIKTYSISDGSKWARGGKSALVQCTNPNRWRGAKGHVMKDDADWMVDWIPVAINGAPASQHMAKTIEYDVQYAEECNQISDRGARKKKANKKSHINDCYLLQIIVDRDATSIIWNSVFSLFVVDALACTGWGVELNGLADRMSIVLTMVLTVMAFKYTLSDALPNVPYLTILDKFVVSSFLTICVQGFAMWFISEMDAYYCSESIVGERYFFERRATVNSTTWNEANMENTCDSIYTFDRVCMLIQMISIAVKMFYFAIMRPCGFLISKAESFDTADKHISQMAASSAFMNGKHSEMENNSEWDHSVQPRTYEKLEYIRGTTKVSKEVHVAATAVEVRVDKS